VLAANEDLPAHSAESFARELYWREFSHHLLFHYPHLPERNWRSAFDAYPWRQAAGDLEAWQRGRTGYPLVDAGMRELWATGYMHNRVRMVAASFLVKQLRINWREGEAWFWDTLVDADLANNSASWQWVTGSGADAARYFRIFNPVTQGRKFDPDGAYVRRWAPELARLANRYLHAPFEAPAPVLRDAGVELGKTYPHPMVDLALARAAALDGYEAVKSRAASMD
jgi:deoxyribodipyrimidine photo-lyase